MVFLSVGVLSFAPAVFAGGEERVVATYYHGTIRCFECLEIERFSRQTLEERFAEQLAAGKLEWRVAGETWKQIAAYPEALMDYVEEELGEMTSERADRL